MEQNEANNPPPPPPPPAGSIFDEMRAIVATRTRLTELRQYHGVAEGEEIEETGLGALEIDVNNMSQLLITQFNGSRDLPEQVVRVDYLREDQRLLIPSILGMNIRENQPGRCLGNPLLRTRYRKLTTLTYAEMVTLMGRRPTRTAVCAAVDAIQEPPAPAQGWVLKTDWRERNWYIDADGLVVGAGHACMVLGTLSQLLMFNADFRDFGFLLLNGNTCTDNAWQFASTAEADRLNCKLMPYSLQTTAALNYVPSGSFGLSAWVRSFGISMGLVPSGPTVKQSELKFIAAPPPAPSITAVLAFEAQNYQDLFTVCANVISMFGLLHLNKDHTYKTGDANMERIGTSYINAIRTTTNKTLIDQMLGNRESILRTAVHPFGLGQTYFCALVMHRHKYLATPLAIRYNVCPPPVQRVLIADATRKEWAGLPAAADLCDAFSVELETIAIEAAMLKTMGPHYSGLFRLYGLDRQLIVTQAATDAVAAIMPAIAGYVRATHMNEGNTKEGLGHAQSLQNVEKEMKALVVVWEQAWDSYFTSIEKTGLGGLIDQLASTKEQRRINRDQARVDANATIGNAPAQTGGAAVAGGGRA